MSSSRLSETSAPVDAGASVREQNTEDYDSVGPVLRNNQLGAAVLEAIRALNPEVKVIDRGAYLRVLVPRRCVVTRQAIERQLARPFRLPGELEALMPSFKGIVSIDEERAAWEFHER